MSNPARILCSGDLHMGRYPSKIPDDPTCSVRHVWEDLVDLAVRREADAVILTGDVVDRENARFEALGPLQKGINRLAEAGIDTITVAGNHDHEALPRLYDLVDAERFYLLGKGGEWESHIVRRDGTDLLRVLGWSFPRRHVSASPVPEMNVDRKTIPTVAALHAELGVADSPYAPVTIRELANTPVDAWLLGHIHAPGRRHDKPVVLYPGSLQPLDPGEAGARGPWLVEVDAGGEVSTEHIPLASLYYAELGVAVEEGSEENLEVQLNRAIREDLEDQRSENGHLRRAVYRIQVNGRSERPQELTNEAEKLAEHFTVPSGEVDAHIDRITADIRPAVDLEQLAEQRNPAGVLARHLLRLEQGETDGATGRLLDRLKENVQTVRQSTGYAALDDDPVPDSETLQQEALRQGRLLLDELLSQTTE